MNQIVLVYDENFLQLGPGGYRYCHRFNWVRQFITPTTTFSGEPVRQESNS